MWTGSGLHDVREVVVLDDGSTNESHDVLATSREQISLFLTERRGQTFATMAAI
jgi:hypothetical protein